MILSCFIQIHVIFHIIPPPATDVVMLKLIIGHPFTQTEELRVLVIGALNQPPCVLGIIKVRKLDREVGPLWAFGDLLSAYRHNKVFDVEAGTLNPAVVHHGSPPLEENLREGLAERSQAGPCRGSRGVWVR